MTLLHLKPLRYSSHCTQQEHLLRVVPFLVGFDWPCNIRPSDVRELNFSSINAALTGTWTSLSNHFHFGTLLEMFLIQMHVFIHG